MRITHDAIIHIHRPEYYTYMGCSFPEHLHGYTELHISKVASTNDFIILLSLNCKMTKMDFMSQDNYYADK